MKSNIITVALLFISFSFAQAQWGQKKSPIEFNHGLGISLTFPQIPTSGGAPLYPAFAWSPRLNVYKFSSDATISANVPITLLIPGTTYNVGGTTVAVSDIFYYDIGINANFNYGLMATKTSTMKIGGFAGLGFGYSPLTFNRVNYYTQQSETSKKTMGIYAEAGFRWLGFFGKKKTPNSIRVYIIVGFNNVLILGFTLTKEFGHKGGKKSGW